MRVLIYKAEGEGQAINAVYIPSGGILISAVTRGREDYLSVILNQQEGLLVPKDQWEIRDIPDQTCGELIVLARAHAQAHAKLMVKELRSLFGLK